MSLEETSAGEETSPAVSRDATALNGRRTWLTVARKDVADAARSWQLYVLTGVFAAVLTLGSLRPLLDEQAFRDADVAIAAQAGLESMAGLVGVFVPLVILVLGHMSIVGERERGSLRVLLALPVSRRDVLVGTLLGRTLVVGGTLLAALAANGVAMLLLYDSIDVGTYVGFSIAAVAFGAVFVAMAVGISAGSRTRGRSIGVTMGAFLLVTFLWRSLLPLVEAVTGVVPEYNITTQNIAPGWYVLLERARPAKAWKLVVTEWGVPVMPELGKGEKTYYAPFTTPSPEPFYLDAWFLALVLLAWGAIPLLVGYWRFRAADIG